MVEEAPKSTMVAPTDKLVEETPKATMLIDTCQGGANPIVDSVPVIEAAEKLPKPVSDGEKDDEDDDNYDEFGNKVGQAEDEDMENEDEGVTQREFDLTGQLGESVSSIPEKLQQLVLTSGQLAAKSKNWRAISRKRFSDRRKHGYVESQKELLPPEVLR